TEGRTAKQPKAAAAQGPISFSDRAPQRRWLARRGKWPDPVAARLTEASMKIYGDSISGNCLKVKWVADLLGRPYVWIETDILQGQSRTAEFLALNPAGQVPLVVLDDGRPLAQSNAIIAHLAEGSDLIPADAYDRAKMFEWMF